MSRTMAVHVRYNSWYISLPSSAKQQREMIKFCVAWGTWPTTVHLSFFHLELNAVTPYLAWPRFQSNRRTCLSSLLIIRRPFLPQYSRPWLKLEMIKELLTELFRYWLIFACSGAVPLNWLLYFSSCCLSFIAAKVCRVQSTHTTLSVLTVTKV